MVDPGHLFYRSRRGKSGAVATRVPVLKRLAGPLYVSPVETLPPGTPGHRSSQPAAEATCRGHESSWNHTEAPRQTSDIPSPMLASNKGPGEPKLDQQKNRPAEPSQLSDLWEIRQLLDHTTKFAGQLVRPQRQPRRPLSIGPGESVGTAEENLAPHPRSMRWLLSCVTFVFGNS